MKEDVFDTFEEESISLQTVDVMSGINQKISDSVKYPCVVVSGIRTKEELLFFHGRGYDGERMLPLYLDYNGLLKKIGVFTLNLSSLLLLRSIGDYSVKICKSANEFRGINLNDPDQLIKFIEL